MISSFQSLSHVWLFANPWTAACRASLSITNPWSLLKLMSIKLVMTCNHLILCCLLLLPPSIFPRIRVFSKESVLCIRWPKYWNFSFSISSSNEYSGLISFRIDWFDLLAVQGALKSLLQHHSSKVPILWHSAVFMVQVSDPYLTTGKIIALTRQTFVAKVMSPLFNMLSRFIIAFLPESKHLLTSWLQSPSAVILEPKKIKSVIFSPSICHEVMGPVGEGNGNPLQYSCLENPMDRGAWWATVHGVTKRQTWLKRLSTHARKMGLDAMSLVFWMLSFKPAFSLFSFTFIKRLFSSSSLSAIRVVSSAYLRLLIFLPATLIPACAFTWCTLHKS